MQSEKHVLITFKNGMQMKFTIDCHSTFMLATETLAQTFGKWMYVGSSACIRKSEVLSIIYKAESHE